MSILGEIELQIAGSESVDTIYWFSSIHLQHFITR